MNGLLDSRGDAGSFDHIPLSHRLIPPDLAQRIPRDFARKNRLIIVEERAGEIVIATSKRESFTQIEVAGRFLNAKTIPWLVEDSEIEIALDRAYGRVSDAVIPVGTVVVESREHSVEDATEDAAAVRVLDALLHRAVRDGASDIHIEPFEKGMRARLRIDGILHTVATDSVSPRALAARCKVIAEMDTAENRRPQDGRFRAEVEGRTLDVRVSTIGTAFGEKVVLRILDRERAILDLGVLGMEGEMLASFRAAIRRPHGLILVTGPTGSGKTTTLYAALSERNETGLNLTTVEDPIEYDLYGVNQMQVHPKIGINFAKGLRHILRQDPDIILVGEIRDPETAEVALQAAQTGHLVLSTLHTNDALGAIARLLDMGVEPFSLADSLVAVLSQRLVRTLCKHCREEMMPTEEESARFGIPKDSRVWKNTGCSSCLGTGYRGRIGIHELLSITPSLANQIRSRASSEEMMSEAKRSDHRRLIEAGVAKALAGVTTLEEVGRVV